MIKFFRNLKLHRKVVIMAVLPVLVMCIVAIVINNTVVKDKLLDDAKQELRATAKAVLAAYDQNTGDYFENSSGDIWKGAYNVSLSTGFIDDIQEKTGVAITFFYGDKRLVTSLVDQKGNRILGSRAGDFVVETVLQDGNELFTNRVLVEDEFYFGYYIPVYQNNSKEIVGMIFAGMPVVQITRSLSLITTVFIVAIVLILAFTILICSFVAMEIAKKIRGSMDVVSKISEGNLTTEIDKKVLERKDEVGDLSNSTKKLIDSLQQMIGKIGKNSFKLRVSSQEMSAVVQQTSEAMQNINQGLNEVLDGAVEQAGSAQNIKANVASINEHIEKTLSEVGELSGAANQMLKAGQSVDNSLQQLDSSNQEVLREIQNIQNQTMQTNESVSKIMNSVQLISDIAEQTNLLSLNASIEAARAGEAGRGFAVVAGEISQLANQSNIASEEISKVVGALSSNSAMTVKVMDSVQEAINEQTKSVNNTAQIILRVQGHITRVANGVDVIRDSTTELATETDAIKYDLENLSDIADRNETTVQETLSYSNEVVNTVKAVSDMSGEVSNSAEEMDETVRYFTVE